MFSEQDQVFMQQALHLAKQAESLGEVPVGAIVVLDDEVVGQGFNQPIQRHDPSAHAEIQALRDAANTLENYRLVNSTMYVTLEPCVMCAGAMIHARVANVVYAAADPKTGAAGSVFDILQTDKLNHRVQCQGGLLAQQSSQLLKAFFKKRRGG